MEKLPSSENTPFPSPLPSRAWLFLFFYTCGDNKNFKQKRMPRSLYNFTCGNINSICISWRLDIKLPPEPEAEKVEECAEDKAEEGGEGDGEDQPAKKAKLELEAADSENVNDDEAENVATENGKEAEEEGEEERKEEEDATVDEMEAEEADTQVRSFVEEKCTLSY